MMCRILSTVSFGGLRSRRPPSASRRMGKAAVTIYPPTITAAPGSSHLHPVTRYARREARIPPPPPAPAPPGPPPPPRAGGGGRGGPRPPPPDQTPARRWRKPAARAGEPV